MGTIRDLPRTFRQPRAPRSNDRSASPGGASEKAKSPPWPDVYATFRRHFDIPRYRPCWSCPATVWLGPRLPALRLGPRRVRGPASEKQGRVRPPMRDRSGDPDDSLSYPCQRVENPQRVRPRCWTERDRGSGDARWGCHNLPTRSSRPSAEGATVLRGCSKARWRFRRCAWGKTRSVLPAHVHDEQRRFSNCTSRSCPAGGESRVVVRRRALRLLLDAARRAARASSFRSRCACPDPSANETRGHVSVICSLSPPRQSAFCRPRCSRHPADRAR
jgi:hypothetical protein